MGASSKVLWASCAVSIVVAGCAGRALTAADADKLLQRQIDRKGLGIEVDVPGVRDVAGVSYQDVPETTSIGRLIGAGLITRTETTEEVVDMAGEYDGNLTSCLIRVQLRNDPMRAGGTFRGIYLLSRRLNCSAKFGKPEQKGVVTGLRRDHRTWIARFAPPMLGELADSELTIGVGTDQKVYIDGTLRAKNEYPLSLVSLGDVRRVTVTKYEYALASPLKEALRPSGKVSLGRYAVETVNTLTLSGDSSARAGFQWHLELSDVGSAIAPATRLRGSGEASFRRGKDRAWVVDEIRFGDGTAA